MYVLIAQFSLVVFNTGHAEIMKHSYVFKWIYHTHPELNYNFVIVISYSLPSKVE